MDYTQHALLICLGLAAGGLGTLVGAGGGFLLIPALLWLYPQDSPSVLTAISMGVIALNATSGSLAYLYQGRVDWRSSLLFAMAGMPGAWFAVGFLDQVSRRPFQTAFAGLLALIGFLLLLRGRETAQKETSSRPLLQFGRVRRVLKDRSGKLYHYEFSILGGVVASAVVGWVASFLGIGGGAIHVPLLSRYLGFPVHIATATSHLTLAITAWVAVAAHAQDGTLHPGLERLAWLGPGVILGAQWGAAYSDRLRGSAILRLLGFILILVALRLFSWR